MFVFVMLSSLFLAALWSPAGGNVDLLDSLLCDVCMCFCHFPIWYSGSGVALNCIVS